jgi:hypothetical protein
LEARSAVNMLSAVARAEWRRRVWRDLGIAHRIVNGYVYISGNPVTDPEKMAERVEARGLLLREVGRALRQVAHEDGGVDRGVRRVAVPDLPEYEPDEVAFGAGRNTAFDDVLDATAAPCACAT